MEEMQIPEQLQSAMEIIRTAFAYGWGINSVDLVQSGYGRIQAERRLEPGVWEFVTVEFDEGGKILMALLKGGRMLQRCPVETVIGFLKDPTTDPLS
jgi:hypothetical protein